ncbi:hypothetical protein [Deinococcus roseus]|uniref:Pectate lyase n=1 Tax=Deinococcus roseus TaxID=392414 RepID=A0ABQ2CU50_9DEIO|nr:hypothetical protein [Deinococcus roseus]GGJ21048.1 pectate lyase [Deinococcus roseus]
MKDGRSLAMMVLLGLLSCSASNSGGSQNFTISTTPGSLTLQQGQSKEVKVNVQRTGGDFPVQVELENAPAGLTAAPLTIPAESQQGTLTFTASNAATPGLSTTALKGTAAGVTNTISFDVTIQGTTPVDPDLKAFPGAEGFGASATGGRGGKVIYVTNLNADGPGSLQAALDESGKRTVVFKVSGLIDTVVSIRRGDVTIAGQTSPGGITLRGLRIENDDSICEADGCPLPSFTPSNFIVQFLRLRPGLTTDDGLRFHRAKNGIVDHVSVGNAQDEAVQVSFTSDVTIQNALIAETLGEHADLGGMLLNYSDPDRGFPLTRISIHHNTFNRIVGRLPELSRENPSADGTTMQLEVSNNLYYDPGFPMWIGNTSQVNSPNEGYTSHPLYYQANFVGNLYYGNSTNLKTGMFTLEGASSPDSGYLPANTPTRIFMQDNHINLYSGVKDFQLVYCCNDFEQAVTDMGMPFAASNPVWAQNVRHDFPAISYTPADQLRNYAVQNAGVFPRDPMDTRLMDFVQKGIFDPAPRSENPKADTIKLPASLPAAPLDTDSDGMPDTWENANGLNSGVADNNGTNLSKAKLGVEGYTNLEVYLSELARQRVQGK